MKYALSIFFFFSFAIQNIYAKKHLAIFFKEADKFFSTYVIDSKIDYLAIQKDSNTLSNLIQQIEIADISEVDSLTETAFLINAYNLNVIAEILKRLPLTETLYQQDIFIKTEIKIAGEQITFNQIKYERLPFVSKTPLYHFALMQADFNFPMLANFAYIPDKLDNQLEKQTAKVINYESFLEVKDSNIIVPKILKWNKKEITKKEKSILQFINQYRTVAFNIEETKVKFSKPKRWTLYSYVEATQLENESLENIKKNKIKLYNPYALLSKGSTEIRFFLPNDKGFNYRLRYEDPIFSIQTKVGIGKYLNIGFASNASTDIYSESIHTPGLKMWFIPLKKHPNFILDADFFFPTVNSLTRRRLGGSTQFKATYFKFIKNKILIAPSFGYSLQNIFKNKNSIPNWIENVVLLKLPINFSVFYYPNPRLSFLASISFIRFHSSFSDNRSLKQIKGNQEFLITGVTLKFNRHIDLSLRYKLIYEQGKGYLKFSTDEPIGWQQSFPKRGSILEYTLIFSF